MKLTAREKEVLQRLVGGLTINQTAKVMGVSRSTVEKLLSNAKSRTGIKTVVQLVYRAALAGLIVWCCVHIGDTDEMRRNVRLRRREQYEFLQIPWAV